eukprot:XP_019076020.1 PREDICTED: LRR repeats and ubiquitin-like domain-containing protein At2g30105 isoform X2 [Vitis vinifera]
MENSGTSGGVNDAKTATTITLNIKFSGRSIPVSVSPNSTVKDLKSLLQPLTNVLTRGQKLIFKGRVLADGMTLRESEITDGAKVMLMASQGLHQGGGPILKEAPTRPILREAAHANPKGNKRSEVFIDKGHLDRWKLTGVIALSECQLKKLLLSANDILDESISWEGVVSLKSLTVLSLSQNYLTMLPSALGALTSLRQLHIASNKLTSLPIQIGLMTQLEVLKANNNRISTIPTQIGDCNSLIEVEFSSNLLSELPETFSNLQNLKALHLSNNGLKSLPRNLFKMCLQLSTLDLHGTEITMDLLRQFEGWENFDERRRDKHQKQLDFRVVDSTAFDEGADKN